MREGSENGQGRGAEMLRSRGLRQGAWPCDSILINPLGCLLLLLCSFCAQLTPGLVFWPRLES